MSDDATTTGESKRKLPDEVRLFSHSSLFYWWPVWAVGFILAAVTQFGGQTMVTVPNGTKPHSAKTRDIGLGNRKAEDLRILIPPEGQEMSIPEDPRFLKTYNGRGPGVIFTITLLLVVVITNVPLRGMWSVLIIMLIIMLSIIFALAGWWDKILNVFGQLDIRINMGGYIFISTCLFVLWLVTFLFFDRQIYMIFQPGQFKVRLEIGAGEKAYDTIGMTIERQRSDLFRHWFLGLGSGDMIVRTSGADAHEFRLQNVLFVGKKLQLVEEMQRVRQERGV